MGPSGTAPRSLLPTDPHSFCVAVQAFRLGQRDDMRRVLLQPLPRVCDHADALHEIVDPQGRNISGGSRGGQYVRRAGEVVADGFGRVRPHEDRTRVADLVHERPRPLHQQLDVRRFTTSTAAASVGTSTSTPWAPSARSAMARRGAATGCGPLTRMTRSRQASAAAARPASVARVGGVTMTISFTPATRAGTAFIITVDG